MSNTVAQEGIQISCDYLVIGAGTSNLSFVDTLLELLPGYTFILADRFPRPGGHWTKAYPFVQLHQTSCSYGVNSLQLGKNRSRRGFERFDHSDRATGEEVCEYYSKVVERFKATERVKAMFNTEYTWDEDTRAHRLTSVDGKRYVVTCTKIVQTESKVIVPSMRDVPFPTDEGVEVVPINALPEKLTGGSSKSKYVIIGAGKSGTDAVSYLLSQGIDENAITWIISRDVWYFIRDGLWPRSVPGGKYHANIYRNLLKPLLKASNCDEYFLEMEKAGSAGRIDPNGPVPPLIFKGAMIDKSELEGIRKVTNIVKMGRVTSITCDEIILERGVVPFSSESTLVVDCMAEDVYGYLSFGKDFEIFNPGRIRLGPPILIFNPSFTAALVAFLESEYSEDDVKNRFLYFGKDMDKFANMKNVFILSLYAHLKTLDVVGKKCKGGLEFITTSRTNNDAIIHHRGILPLLWALFGPMRLDKKVKKLMKRIETGGYKGIDSTNLPRRRALDATEVEAARRIK